MPNLGDKFCYVSQDVESFATIVKSSYEATKHDTCLKLGFVPIELVSQDATGCVVRVPGALRNSISGCYTWVITHALLDTLERIGDATLTPIGVEMWRIKRSMEMLKRQATQAIVDTPTAASTVTQPTPVASTADVKPVKQTRKEKVAIAIPESLDSAVTVPKSQVEKAIKQPKPIPEPWPEVPAPKGIRVIKTYADGSQILDDGKERWLNADWTQPVKYVCS